MGLEHVKDGILAEGRAAAEREVAQARAEAQAMLARAEQQAQETRAQGQQHLQASVQALKRRELALAELDAKKLRLHAEKELLARVRGAALERLAKLPAQQDQEYVQALLKRAAMEQGRVYAKPQHAELVRKLGFTFAGPLEGVGGVIVESPDGTTREDLRYENLLDEAWRDSLGDVAKHLFSAPGAAKAR